MTGLFVVLLGLVAAAATPTVQRAGALKVNPLRDAYYGDLHLHTSYSLDTYLGGASQVDPDMAYRFARGDVIDYLGQPLQRREPLDFLAVTDHAENLGVVNELDDPDSAVSRSEMGRKLKVVIDAMRRPDGRFEVEQLVDKPQMAAELYALSQEYGWGLENRLPPELRVVAAAAWRREVDFANRNNVPGRFTAFAAFEWSAAAHGANLHRNVIFRGAAPPQPFSSFDSRNPEDLWHWLDIMRQQGYEALAIPHNANASNGLMYDWLDSVSGYIDRNYAQARQAHEPLSEISQNKGASETHPLLSPNDEFANHEIFDYMAGDRRYEGRVPGSYLRDALGRGAVLQREVGVNPFKYGFVGASDLHSGLSVSAQADYGGSYYRPNLGAGRPTREEAASILSEDAPRVEQMRPTTSGGLTGIWAESNTRESLFDAMRRRETFATSGTRLKVRFFGGWHLPPSLVSDKDGIRTAYRIAVPMGGDLSVAPPGAGAPSFAVWAVKDPNGGNLDRIQIVKVWEQDGRPREQVFDVAWSGKRKPDERTGHLPPVGNSVDLATARYRNDIGATELRAVWSDPQFDAHRYSAYYVRVLEIPTPRWSTLLAVQAGVPLPHDVPAVVQQRAWSSPIWYSPQHP